MLDVAVLMDAAGGAGGGVCVWWMVEGGGGAPGRVLDARAPHGFGHAEM